MNGSSVFSHQIIRASAGTGKTFQLANRYLGLLVANQNASQILATTFTRKAAGEILDRIILRLADAALDSSEAATLSQFLGVESLDRETYQNQLAKLLTELNVLKISTLDSFFGQLARRFCFELGLSPGWTIVEELVDVQLRSEATRRMLSEDGARDLLGLLTKGDADRSVSQLIRDTTNSLYELYLNSQQTAWEQLQRPKGLEESVFEETIERLRDLADSDDGFAKQIQLDLVLAEMGDWDEFIKKGLGGAINKGNDKYRRKPIPAETLSCYQKLISHAQSVLVGKVVNRNEAAFQLLKRFDLHYQNLKSEFRALRFEDVTRLLSQGALHDSSETLAFRSDGQFNHLLLDEFQDTSPSQWNVVRGMAQRITEMKGESSFFCVGDVKQAIYGWRGGVAEIFDSVSEQLSNITEAKPLTKSYRSSPVVIDLVNRVFQGLLQHGNLDNIEAGARDWVSRFQTHTTAKTNLPGYACLQVANHKEQVFNLAVDKVATIYRQDPSRSIAVLVRSNKAVGKLVHLFGSIGIPASEEGGNPLTDSAAVQIVLSAMSLADHPGDRIARYHLSHSVLGDRFGLVPESIESQQANAARSPALSSEIRQRLCNDGYGEVVNDWAQSLYPVCNSREMTRLQQLVDLAFLYDQQATLRPIEFLHFVENRRVSDPTTAQVRVMTIHQAKGLEFDTVVLPELDRSIVGQSPSFVTHRPDPTGPAQGICFYVNESTRALLPNHVQGWFDEQRSRTVAEELCVLYVALTRAVHATHIMIAPNEKEKKLPKTLAAMIRAALTDGRPPIENEMLFEMGAEQWSAQMDVVETEAKSGENQSDGSQCDLVPCKSLIAEPIRLKQRSEPTSRDFEFSSPSAMEGGSIISIDQMLRGGNARAMKIGTLIHAWFEQVEWLEEGLPDDEHLLRVARQVGEFDSEAVKWLARFREMVAKPRIRELLTQESYLKQMGSAGSTVNVLQTRKNLTVEVENEYRFSILEGKGILNGSIDRLLIFRENEICRGADIVDFKTDQLSSENGTELRAKVAHYQPQIEAYRRAVASFLGLSVECVTSRLVFVQHDLVESVG